MYLFIFSRSDCNSNNKINVKLLERHFSESKGKSEDWEIDFINPLWYTCVLAHEF